MNLLSKLKVLWKVRKPIGNIQEAVMQKSGWKTSEFYLVLITNLITIAGALQGVIDPKTMAIVIASLNGIYGVLRTLVKLNGGSVPAENTPPTQ